MCKSVHTLLVGAPAPRSNDVMPRGNGKSVDSPVDQSRPQNELGGPPQSASRTPRRSRLRRTLLFAGVFALLAMLYVPMPKHGYRLIFDLSDTSIAFFQLLGNVGLAALVGALAANFSRRTLLWTAWIVAIAAVAVVGLLGFSAFQRQMKAGAEREEALARFEITLGNLELAKEHFLKTSNYWWWKGWWDGARDARRRAFDEQGMKKQAAVFRAQRYEKRAADLLRLR
jgi:hypothetical protein